MSFYDEVLRQLVIAIGAALFFGNLYALWRRRADRARMAASKSAKSGRRGRSAAGPRSGRGPKPPGRTSGGDAEAAPGRSADDLAVAPVVRTVTYAVLGLVMVVAGLASIIAA